ncbi:MAG: type II toxin-antitoxin system VapC family toxin [Nanoarchaeota archaeon]
MMYILDSNVIIDIYANNYSVINRLKELDLVASPGITVLSYAEILYGISNKEYDKVKEHIDKNFRLYSISRNAAEIYIQYKKKLKRKGKRIPEFDMLIGAIVKDNRATLITSDKHFESLDIDCIFLK